MNISSHEQTKCLFSSKKEKCVFEKKFKRKIFEKNAHVILKLNSNLLNLKLLNLNSKLKTEKLNIFWFCDIVKNNNQKISKFFFHSFQNSTICYEFILHEFDAIDNIFMWKIDSICAKIFKMLLFSYDYIQHLFWLRIRMFVHLNFIILKNVITNFHA